MSPPCLLHSAAQLCCAVHETVLCAVPYHIGDPNIAALQLLLPWSLLFFVCFVLLLFYCCCDYPGTGSLALV